jgi:transcriptional regulator with XRE-family HTH domain
VKAKPPPRPNVRELLALNLKRLRAVHGWSQDVLALEAGLDRTFVAHVERMKRNISLDNIEKLAAALNVPLASLMEIGLRQAPAKTANRAVRQPLAKKTVKSNRSLMSRRSRTVKT